MSKAGNGKVFHSPESGHVRRRMASSMSAAAATGAPALLLPAALVPAAPEEERAFRERLRGGLPAALELGVMSVCCGAAALPANTCSLK